jgi:membrane protein implicated in regulation of membrane protease activity
MISGFEPDFWHWWVLGLGLLVLEVFVPGTFFLWMSISSAIVGALMLAIPGLSLEWQLMIFTVLSLTSVISWKVYFSKHPEPNDQPTLNRRGEQYIGRVFTLDEAIVNGVGHIRVDDTMWRIEGADCEEGNRVRVTGVNGVNLKVEPEA